MRIYLNDAALEREATGALTVGQVIDDLQREISAGGKVVTGIRIDGNPIESGYRKRRQFERVVDTISRLDMNVANPEFVVQQMLNDSAQICSTLPERCEDIALRFRLGEEARANNGLADMLDQLSLLTKSASVFDRWVHNTASRQLSQTLESLTTTMNDILKAQTNGDYIALADALEYDLKPSLGDCMSTTSELKTAQIRSTPVLD